MPGPRGDPGATGPARHQAARPEARAAEPVEAAEESGAREALLRVLDNQAAEIHPQFGPYGPYPHTRTGDARPPD